VGLNQKYPLHLYTAGGNHVRVVADYVELDSQGVARVDFRDDGGCMSLALLYSLLREKGDAAPPP
jgi:hypothetical protein